MAESPTFDTQAIGAAYFNAFNNRDLAAFDELLAPEFISHLRVGDIEGVEAFKATMVGIFEGIPDMEWGLDEMICTADRVVYRYHFQGTHRGPFLGIPASGRFVRQDGAEVLHIKDGRVTEIWNYTDLMGLAAKLNAVNPLALEI